MKSKISVLNFTDPKVSNNLSFIKTDFSSRLYLWLFIIYMVYAALDTIASLVLDTLGFSNQRWPGAIISLVLYFLLLYRIYRRVRRIRIKSSQENCNVDVFSIEDISLIINRSLLISSIFFFLISMQEGPELFRTGAIQFINLFIGFSVSLCNIVKCTSDKEFLNCFKTALTEIGLSKKNWKKILLILTALLFAVWITTISRYILLCIIVAILLVIIIASKIREAIRKKIYKSISSCASNGSVLALELCPDKAITTGTINYLRNNGATYKKINSISDIQKNKYNVVIISNALSRKQDIHKHLQKANKYLAEDGVLVAPACICKNERSNSILGRLGFYQHFLQSLTEEEYINQVNGNGWTVDNVQRVYEPTRITYLEMRRGKDVNTYSDCNLKVCK